MKIYRAGTRYFSTYLEAKIYREKYFNSARYIETIDVESGTIDESEDVIAKVQWYKSSSSGGLCVRAYWCCGTIEDFTKTDTQLNVATIRRPIEDMVYVDVFMKFRNMRAARYRANSRKLLNFLESEIEKVPTGSEVQIKI